jgi:hypothetical protein
MRSMTATIDSLQQQTAGAHGRRAKWGERIYRVMIAGPSYSGVTIGDNAPSDSDARGKRTMQALTAQEG